MTFFKDGFGITREIYGIKQRKPNKASYESFICLSLTYVLHFNEKTASSYNQIKYSYA